MEPTTRTRKAKNAIPESDPRPRPALRAQVERTDVPMPEAGKVVRPRMRPPPHGWPRRRSRRAVVRRSGEQRDHVGFVTTERLALSIAQYPGRADADPPAVGDHLDAARLEVG